MEMIIHAKKDFRTVVRAGDGYTLPGISLEGIKIFSGGIQTQERYLRGARTCRVKCELVLFVRNGLVSNSESLQQVIFTPISWDIRYAKASQLRSRKTRHSMLSCTCEETVG